LHDVYDRLAHVTGADLQHVELTQAAILFGLGSLEAARGLPSAAERAELLEREPLQMVNAMYLRRVMRLQLGDFEGAEDFRRRAELLAVQANSRQMFTSVLIELVAYGTARDLTAMREIAGRIAALAEKSPGWITYKLIAEGTLKSLRGDLSGAAHSLEAALLRCWPDPTDPERAVGALPMAAAIYLDVLIALEAYAQAKEFGVRALAEAARADLRTVDEVERGLALAEAKLGDVTGAIARLDAVIARQQALGVTGLLLGTHYEARARIAIWTGDQPALAEYGRLTAQQYRHGRGSPLGARYERLMSEAREAGVPVLPELSEFETSTLGTSRMETRASTQVFLSFAVRSARDPQQRASAVLRMIAQLNRAESAHLFLVQADGSIRWAASHGAQLCGDTELALAHKCLESAVNDEFGSTQLESELAPATAETSAVWKDDAGVPHHVQLLSGFADGSPRYVAVVVSNAPSARRQNPMLLKAVAECFLTSGDTEGLALE
jgi:tetratricopeptide (TPR) repeat protein